MREREGEGKEGIREEGRRGGKGGKGGRKGGRRGKGGRKGGRGGKKGRERYEISSDCYGTQLHGGLTVLPNVN